MIAILRQSVEHQLEAQAGEMLAELAAMTPAQASDAIAANAEDAVANALMTWIHKPQLCGVALVAATIASNVGFRGRVDKLLDAVVACTEKHLSNPQLARAGLHWLRYHSTSPHAIEQAPRVAALACAAALKHPSEERIELYTAWIFLGLLALEPDDVAKRHGALGLAKVQDESLKIVAKNAATQVFVNGEAWNAFALRVFFPRMRSSS